MSWSSMWRVKPKNMCRAQQVPKYGAEVLVVAKIQTSDPHFGHVTTAVGDLALTLLPW